MTDRIQRVLDGDVDPASLSRAEREALAETEALITGLCREIPAGSVPNLAPSVLARIAAAGSRHTRRREWTFRAIFGWLWRPHRCRLVWRPAYAVAMLALLAGLAFRTPVTAPVETHGAPAGGRSADRVLVEFRLDAPHAERVTLAGDFTRWQPAYPLARSGPGVWTVVVPLEPGVHDYAFVVDGERWVPDPAAPAIDDGFGGLNSRIAVLAPDTGRPL